MNSSYPFGEYFPQEYNNEKYNQLFSRLDHLDLDPSYSQPQLGKTIDLIGTVFFDYTAWIMLMVQDHGVRNKGVSNIISTFGTLIPIAVLSYTHFLIPSEIITSSNVIEFGNRTNAHLNLKRGGMLLQSIKPLVYEEKPLLQISVAEHELEKAHMQYLLLVTPEPINKKKEGCYIATMVYNDYNAPEVIKLREFRDNKLKPYLIGRLFIHIYYSISPAIVTYLSPYPKTHKFLRALLSEIFNLKT